MQRTAKLWRHRHTEISDDTIGRHYSQGRQSKKIVPDSGFSPFAVWTGEGWSDVSRGSDINTMFDTLITIGFEQNLSAYCGKTVFNRSLL